MLRLKAGMDISQAEQRMKALAADTADEEGGEAGSESNGTGDDEMEEDTDDMDSEELRQDLRAFGIRQLLPMEVRTCLRVRGGMFLAAQSWLVSRAGLARTLPGHAVCMHEKYERLHMRLSLAAR